MIARLLLLGFLLGCGVPPSSSVDPSSFDHTLHTALPCYDCHSTHTDPLTPHLLRPGFACGDCH